MPRARVLIVYGTKGDSSDDLARRLALALNREGVPAQACEADEVTDLEAYDGVALTAAREGDGWTRFARDFARRHASELRTLPTWFLPRTRGPADVDTRDRARWAHTIARGLGEPPTAPRPIAFVTSDAPRPRRLIRQTSLSPRCHRRRS